MVLFFSELLFLSSFLNKPGPLKKVYISVINDLFTDQRVLRVIDLLVDRGAGVTFIGRRLRNSPDLGETAFQYKRFRMLFTAGPLFYAAFNTRLFLVLLFKPRPDLLISNDLDTLPANYMISRIRKVPLIYDSHEYFTEVPELINRPFTQKIWKGIERCLVPKIQDAVTVSPSIAGLYMEEYKKEFRVVRNLPRRREPVSDPSLRERYGGKNIILYQGAINIGRGLEVMIRTMQYLDNAVFLVAGAGDIVSRLESMINELNVGDRVFLIGRLHPDELFPVTCNADIGLSFEEDMGLNYRYALPNKLFDYIHAGIPVLCSDLPEMKSVVEQYGVGIATSVREPERLAGIIQNMFRDKKAGLWDEPIKEASQQLCWEKESKIYAGMIAKFGI